MSPQSEDKNLFERFCVGFAEAFGSAGSFAGWFVLCVLWLAIIPWLGIARWNGSWGLGGNTVESTFELFLGLALLYKTNKIDAKTETHRDELIDKIEHLEEQILLDVEKPVV